MFNRLSLIKQYQKEIIHGFSFRRNFIFTNCFRKNVRKMRLLSNVNLKLEIEPCKWLYQKWTNLMWTENALRKWCTQNLTNMNFGSQAAVIQIKYLTWDESIIELVELIHTPKISKNLFGSSSNVQAHPWICQTISSEWFHFLLLFV